LSLSPNSLLAILFGVVAVALAAWIVVALRTGKTLFISRTRRPQMVDRQTNALSFWSMVVCLSALFIAAAAMAAGEWTSN
jgi:hypothetical protein